MQKSVPFIVNLFFLFSLLLTVSPVNAGEVIRSAAPQGVEQKDYDAYRDLVGTLSSEEQEWEKALEKYLGNFYFPLHLKDKVAKRSNAWDFVKDEPGLPRIFLIGDSISRSYTQPLRGILKGKVNVHRAPANCGPTTTGLKEINGWLTEGQGKGKWDLIVFNFGIHDRNRQSAEYEANLEKVVELLQKTEAKLLWVRTTPFNDATDPAEMPFKSPKLNDVSDKVMKKYGVPMCDLYTPIVGRAKELIGEDRTHFSAQGQTVLAEELAKSILPLLP